MSEASAHMPASLYLSATNGSTFCCVSCGDQRESTPTAKSAGNHGERKGSFALTPYNTPSQPVAANVAAHNQQTSNTSLNPSPTIILSIDRSRASAIRMQISRVLQLTAATAPTADHAQKSAIAGRDQDGIA
jgi:hypothetical protein